MDRHLPLRPGLGHTRAVGATGPAWSLGAETRGSVPTYCSWWAGREAFVRSPEAPSSKLHLVLWGVVSARARTLAPLLIAANFISLTLFTLEPLNCFSFIFSNFIMH